MTGLEFLSANSLPKSRRTEFCQGIRGSMSDEPFCPCREGSRKAKSFPRFGTSSVLLMLSSPKNAPRTAYKMRQRTCGLSL